MKNTRRKVDANFIQQPFQLEVRRMEVEFFRRKWGIYLIGQKERPRLTYRTVLEGFIGEGGFLCNQRGMKLSDHWPV